MSTVHAPELNRPPLEAATAGYMFPSGDGCELVKDCGRTLSMDQRFQGERTDGLIKATAEPAEL